MSSYDFKLYKSLGSLIKDYRQWRGLSQETFSVLIGISVRELRRWEADRRRARIENLHDISEATGIPMQTCVALNADQPIWYSFSEKRFTYSSVEIEHFSFDELFKSREKSDEGIFVKSSRILTDRHMSMILSCHRDIYGTEKLLEKDVIKAAIEILPDLNLIIFDSWGHYVGHHVCLPIKTGVYQQLKKQKSLEDYLTTERISDIVALHEGVFLYYSVFAVSGTVGHTLLRNSVRYYAEMQQKEGYIDACYVTTRGVTKACENLGMRKVWSKMDNVRDNKPGQSKIFPKIYEIELDVIMRSQGPFAALESMIKEYGGRVNDENLAGDARRQKLLDIPAQKPNNSSHLQEKVSTREMSYYGPFAVDGPFRVDRQEQYGSKRTETQVYKSKMEACPNPKCTLHGKMGKGNILFNGTYPTKEGNQGRRFLCKECGESFCGRAGTIFHNLRSPEQRILMAFKLLAKGMTLRGVAKALGVKRDTVRNWLKVAAEGSEKIDAMLMRELDVSQVELDALWTSVKKNSLRQRAILWKTGVRSVSSSPNNRP